MSEIFFCCLKKNNVFHHSQSMYACVYKSDRLSKKHLTHFIGKLFHLPGGGGGMGPCVVVLVGVHEQCSSGKLITFVPSNSTFNLLSNCK